MYVVYYIMAKDYERRAKKQKKLPTNHIPQKKYSTDILTLHSFQ